MIQIARGTAFSPAQHKALKSAIHAPPKRGPNRAMRRAKAKTPKPPAIGDDLPALECGGCRTCCLGDTIVLMPEHGDDYRMFQTVLVDGKHHIAKGPDGNCAHLTETGCGVYENQPHICKAFDCRKSVLKLMRLPRHEVNKRLLNPHRLAALKEGRRRLDLHLNGEPVAA